MPMTQVPDGLRIHAVRVRRAAVIVGLASAAIAASVVMAAPALAVTGFELDLTVSPASGPLSSVPTWSTSTACLSGYQTSAVLYELNTDGSIALAISPVVTDVSSPFAGTLLTGDTAGTVLAGSNVTPGGTVQWVVECFAGAGGTGSSVYVQSVDVTLSPDGSSYTTACTGVNACLIPPSGATSLTPGWATTTECPVAYLGSAALYTLNGDGSLGTRISPVVSDVPASGTLLADVAQDISGTGVTDGETDEWVVVCFGGPGGTGPYDEAASIYVTLSADGSSYTSSGTPPPLTATTTTMTASPQPTVPGTLITMTATVTAADGTNPAGSVLFDLGGSGSPVFIGGPVAVNADGVATTTSTNFLLVAGSYSLEAVFTPANTFSYASSTGTFTETANGGSVPVTVSVPSAGAFTVTVTPGTVILSVAGTSYPPVATGMLQPVTVADTRNTYPGWSVSGQVSAFTGSGTAAGSTIPGDQLGWVPTGTLADGTTLGPAVAPGTSPGLGDTAQVLAAATPGNGMGTSTLGANLTLDTPGTALAGPYAATLTITFVESGP
jgi:hypothetical protein